MIATHSAPLRAGYVGLLTMTGVRTTTGVIIPIKPTITAPRKPGPAGG